MGEERDEALRGLSSIASPRMHERMAVSRTLAAIMGTASLSTSSREAWADHANDEDAVTAAALPSGAGGRDRLL